jgi:hypothetical protein
MRMVTETEMLAHLSAWPRPLVRDFCSIVEPPMVSFNDFTLGKWPESVVASYSHQDWLDENGKLCEPRDTNWTIKRELP